MAKPTTSFKFSEICSGKVRLQSTKIPRVGLQIEGFTSDRLLTVSSTVGDTVDGIITAICSCSREKLIGTAMSEYIKYSTQKLSIKLCGIEFVMPQNDTPKTWISSLTKQLVRQYICQNGTTFILSINGIEIKVLPNDGFDTIRQNFDIRMKKF